MATKTGSASKYVLAPFPYPPFILPSNSSLVWFFICLLTLKSSPRFLLDFREAQTNPRGIPYAPFVDKVEDYVITRADVESTLRSFQEMVAKYNFMEENLRRRVAGLKDKMPDIGKTLETVRFLKLQMKKGEDELEDEDDEGKKGGGELETLFELNDTLYAKAKIERDEGSGRVEEVYLWLGVS